MIDASENLPRYAVYFVPPADSELYRFGASVLGYDSYSSAPVLFHPACAAWPRPWDEIIREPGRYGFHATLKAPFRLARGMTETDLGAAIEQLASNARPIPILKLKIGLLGDFVAMTPCIPCDVLQQLAADCVTALDRYRMPLSEQERLRRRPERLNERQRAYLEQWGYPYVFDEFRFHMTLTGPLAPPEREAIMSMLQQAFGREEENADIAIDHLSLLCQSSSTEPFRMIGQWKIRC